MTPDTVLTFTPYADARKLCYPIVWKVTGNGVHVIISPNGVMNNIVGEENVDKFIDNYKEKYLEENLAARAERERKTSEKAMRELEARINHAN